MFKGTKRDYKIIGICSAEIQREIEKKVIFSISNEAIKNGYKILMFNTFADMYGDDSYEKGEVSVYKLINHDMIDALVVMPATIERDDVVSEIVSDAKDEGVPVFSFDQEFEGCRSVHLNYADNFENIVRHVVQKHDCKNVYMMAGTEGNSFSQTRIDTYRMVLEDNGIEFDQKKVLHGDFWEYPTRKAMENFFESGEKMPDAFVCANDTMAIIVSQELRKHGYEVPRDVIVTGFDGSEMEKYTSPRLTTAEPDYDEIGRVMIDEINKVIAGEDVPKRTDVSYNVRISESCGCKSVNPTDVLEKILELNDTISWSEGHELHMFSYSSMLGHCESPDEMGEKIWHFADHHSWVCLNTDCFEQEREKYRYKKFFTAKMNNVMTRDEEEFIGNRIFNPKTLLPDMEKVLEKFDCLMISPIHHQQYVLGYYVMSFDTNAKDFRNTRRFIKNTDNIIENLRNRFIVQKTAKKLEEMCIKDYLTGIYNRQGFFSLAGEVLEKCSENKRNIVIFSFDMDGMNTINNTYGHNEGDRAIIAVARAIENSAKNGEIVARFGGDEFVAVGEEISEDYAQKFEQSVVDELEKFNNADENRPYRVVISCGYVSAKCSDADDIYEKMRVADGKMYIQKRSHKAQRNDG